MIKMSVKTAYTLISEFRTKTGCRHSEILTEWNTEFPHLLDALLEFKNRRRFSSNINTKVEQEIGAMLLKCGYPHFAIDDNFNYDTFIAVFTDMSGNIDKEHFYIDLMNWRIFVQNQELLTQVRLAL